MMIIDEMIFHFNHFYVLVFSLVEVDVAVLLGIFRFLNCGIM